MKAAGVVVAALLSTAVAMWQWTVLAAESTRLRQRVDTLEQRAREPVAAPPAPVDLGEVRAELRTCARDVVYLREVQRALCAPDGYGRRVRLPDPPPGWEPWPTYPTTGAFAAPP